MIFLRLRANETLDSPVKVLEVVPFKSPPVNSIAAPGSNFPAEAAFPAIVAVVGISSAVA